MNETMGGQPLANFVGHEVDVGFKDDNSHDNLLETFFPQVIILVDQIHKFVQCIPIHLVKFFI